MNEQTIMQALHQKLGITSLNVMQTSVLKAIGPQANAVIYSPTGTGKTIAYALLVLKALKNFGNERLQVVVIAPSRELVTQIYEVMRLLATDHFVTALYGGHKVEDEKNSLLATPSIIVATPGRLLDHCNRGNIKLNQVRQLVLDEFDKCLELGFEDEMKKLMKLMPNLSRRILTSATVLQQIPQYVGGGDFTTVNFLHTIDSLRLRTTIHEVKSSDKDKIHALVQLLFAIPEGKTIVFANYRDAVERIYQHLKQSHISTGIYHGGLEQIDREKAIAMFINESYPILVSTDLGSRGLDIKEVKNVIHYHFPPSEEAFVHRNGRTARVNHTGNVYVLTHQDESLPTFISIDKVMEIPPLETKKEIPNKNCTLFFKAGKKEKISKGDIVGFVVNNSDITPEEIGVINIFDHYALVAVPSKKTKSALRLLQKAKIKGKKVKIELASPDIKLANHSRK
ncbi:MAG: DEAD/DEAH box helicase [Sodaliphilus sp.]